MLEDLIKRIEELERSNRWWRVFALVLAAILLGGSVTGTFFFVQYTKALQAMESARMREVMAREEAEVARRAVEAHAAQQKK